MKLSKTQEELLNKMRKDIDYVRSCKSYEEYIQNDDAYNQRQKDTYIKSRSFEKYYINTKENNIVLTWTSSATLKALEKKGFIKIIVDAKDEIDFVKVLNY